MPSSTHIAAHFATYIGAFGAALVLTLCACAWLTPRSWWRRPNARALGVLAAGTAAGGALLLALFGAPGTLPQPVELAEASPPATDVPVAGAPYRVRDALNLRVAGGTGAERLLVVPGGARVIATGQRDGDWWQVRATVDGKDVEGWASSLWLRRADER